MAFSASLVTCAENEIRSDMWNLICGTHPDLHDDYMDPPERIMVPEDTSDRCVASKNRKCFDIYYGSQCLVIDPYTSAVMEVENGCTFTHNGLEYCDINGNDQKPTATKRKLPKQQLTKDKEPQHSKNFLNIPHHATKVSDSLRRNKSDSDISSLDDFDAHPQARSRILSDSSANKSCVCKCTCGSGKSSLCTPEGKSGGCQRSHGKSRHKSRSLKSILHGILS